MVAKINTAVLCVCLLAVQMCSVDALCYQYVCKYSCDFVAPRYEEYAFQYMWRHLCGERAVSRGVKACCVTYGDYGQPRQARQ